MSAGWLPGEDLIADLRRCLDAAPRDTREDRFEAWAWRAMLTETGPVALTRHGVPHHFTASAMVLDPTGTRTCLVLHARLRKWVQPGGHVEPGDATVTATASREVREETGLTGRVLTGPVALARHAAPCGVPGADWHLDVQHVLIAGPTDPVVSAESLDVGWFDVDDLPEDLAPGVGAGLLRAVARISTERAQSASASRSERSPGASASSGPEGSSSPIRRSRAAAKPSR